MCASVSAHLTDRQKTPPGFLCLFSIDLSNRLLGRCLLWSDLFLSVKSEKVLLAPSGSRLNISLFLHIWDILTDSAPVSPEILLLLLFKTEKTQFLWRQSGNIGNKWICQVGGFWKWTCQALVSLQYLLRHWQHRLRKESPIDYVG